MFGLLDGMFSGWKVWAAIGIVVAVILGSAAVGATVNGWRLEAKYTKALSEKDAQISDLSSKINTQNAAVDILDEKTKNAIERKKLAEKYSADVVNRINKRKAVIEESTATDCEGVLKEAHEDAR